MRTTIKDERYFQTYIERDAQRIEKLLDWIKIGKVKEDRVPSTRGEIFRTALQLIIARYSAGASVAALKKAFGETVNRMAEAWQAMPKGSDGKISLENYVLALWILSLGVLLDADDADFQRIAATLEASGTRDFLLDFFIASRTGGHQVSATLLHPKPYQHLKEIIETPDKDAAAEKLKMFLEKQWYPAMNPNSWYENHKSKHDTFFGYWSFEAAAAAKILGLNDDNLKEQKHYPYDAVHAS